MVFRKNKNGVGFFRNLGSNQKSITECDKDEFQV